MIYYSLATLAQCYRIDYADLKVYVRNGFLKSEKLFIDCKPHIMWKYIIPASELHKLAHLKISEPAFIYADQPNNEQRENLLRENLYARNRNDIRPDCEYFAVLKNYYGYSISTAWNRLRSLCFHRDGYKCKNCGSGINLEMHHVSYEHLYTFAELDDVITLCRDCHTHIHQYDKKKIFAE